VHSSGEGGEVLGKRRLFEEKERGEAREEKRLRLSVPFFFSFFLLVFFVYPAQKF